MAYIFHVRTHPLGVVVTRPSDLLGELLLPGEACYGVGYDELARAAQTTGYIEVSETDVSDSPPRHS